MQTGKRVLFHMSDLAMGGAQIALQRLAGLLCDAGWEVDMILNYGGGALEQAFDPRVRAWVRYPRFVCEQGPTARLGPGGRVLRHLHDRRHLAGRRYDGAVTYLQGLHPALCCSVARARRRLFWVHTDLRAAAGRDRVRDRLLKWRRRIDRVIGVTADVSQGIAEVVPEIAGKIDTLYNVLAPDLICARARAPVELPGRPGRYRIVTVGRLHERSKGLLRIAAVLRRLGDRGLDIDWIMVGEGADRPAFEQEIARLDLQDRLHLVGVQPNPMPYLARADLVAVPSRYEGLNTVINEAKVLGRLVLATDVSGVRLQLENGRGGIIVENTGDALVDGIADAIGNAPAHAARRRVPLPAVILDDDCKLGMFRDLLEG